MDSPVAQLCGEAFDGTSESDDSSRIALKSLANTLLLQESTRQTVVDLGYAGKVADRMKSTDAKSREDELICSRILFLLTYNTNLDFDILFDKHDLAGRIVENVAWHASKYERSEGYKRNPKQSAPMDIFDPTNDRALSETLKLLFNLTKQYPKRVTEFSEAMPAILTILDYIQIEEKPLQPPVSYLINALLNLEIPEQPSISDTHPPPTALFPTLHTTHHVRRLVDLLALALQNGKEEELESTAVPLLTLFRRIADLAPPKVQLYLKKELLPSVTERDQPLGRSNTISSRLLRFSTSAVAPNLKEGISSLLFELSDKDSNVFVRNVGYGYAAGFLMSHNLPVPKSIPSKDQSNSITCVDGQEVNPITGQRLDKESKDIGPDMTDEEKEREAEKLFVLFERLKATGVVDVINPVEQATRQGTVEELESDDRA